MSNAELKYDNLPAEKAAEERRIEDDQLIAEERRLKETRLAALKCKFDKDFFFAETQLLVELQSAAAKKAGEEKRLRAEQIAAEERRLDQGRLAAQKKSWIEKNLRLKLSG